MEPCKVSHSRLVAERWLDEDGSFSSEAVAWALNATQMTTASDRTRQVPDVRRGFTRRCGKRDPVHKSPCMHAYGHEGRHAWEPTYTPEHWREWGLKMTDMFEGRNAASLSSDRTGDGTEVLTLNGKCDLSTALLAEQRIVSALDSGTTGLIFDLRGVTSIDRSMLQVLFRALIRMGRNGRVVLVRPNAHVWAFFEENGLDKGFSTFRNLEGALAEVFVRGPENLLSPGLPSPSGLGRTR
jgi:anti-anti-sigma factor